MKTSVDIPDAELADLLRFTGAKTKREAIVSAVAAFNRRQRMSELLKYTGTFQTLQTNEEIEALELEG